jgi:hypothetical protein
MTDQVPVWYRDQWANNVIVRYQNRGYVLKGTTTPPVKIDGKKFYFLRTGTIDAQPYTRGDAITPLNPNDDRLEFEAKEWDAPFSIFDYDVTRLPVSEVDARQQQCANALGRRSDLIIYDAVMSATLPTGNTFGAYTNAFDPYVFKQGLEKLIDNDVVNGGADGMVFAPLPSLAYAQLETYKIFANSQWVGGDLPLTKMVKHKTWDIAHCFILPPHLRKKYTSTTELRFRVWHKSAVGSGHNEDIRNEWTRDGLKKRWVVNHTIDGAAIALQPEGIIEFRMKADSSIVSEIERTQAVT